MVRDARTVQSWCRRTAWALALVCLWLSGGATLTHTDDLSDLHSFPRGQATLSQASPVAQALPCAAHEWMDAWQTLQTPVCHVVSFSYLIPRVQVSVPPVLHLRPFDHHQFRGPPSLLS